MKVGSLNRRNAGRMVLLAWAIALAWLARRELGKPEAQAIAEATIRLGPESHYFAVLARDRQIGYASLSIDTIRTGFSLSEVLALDVSDADSTRRVTRRSDLVLSRSLRLRQFTRTVSGGGLFEELGGTIEGDSVLRLYQRDSREGPPVEWSLSLPGDVVLPEVLPYRLAFSKRLEVGRVVTARVLDLNTGTIDRVEFRATAESTFVVADSAVEQRATGRWRPVTFDTVRAWRIEHAASGTPTVTWVDGQGGLVRSEAALGVRLERSAFELVSINYREALARRGPGDRQDLPAMRNLLEAGLDPGPADGPTDWRIEAAPIERFLLPRLAWLDGGRQAVQAQALRVGEDQTRPDGRGTRSEYLGPPPGVADSSLRALAASVAGDQGEPEAMARRLVRWVAREIHVDTARGAPVLADRVVATRRAGAEGHVRLFVELARAVDLPARPVSGVAVLEAGAFGHAWSEVWLHGRWVAVDPTFGRVPASTRLVRAAVGGSGRAIDLVPLLGSATFTRVGSPDPELGAQR